MSAQAVGVAGTDTPASGSHLHLQTIAAGAALVLATLLAIGLWLMAGEGSAARAQSLGTKIVEIVVQAIAVTVAGGLLVQAYLKWHAREVAIQDFRRAILDGLIDEYMKAKRVRRVLRASADQDGQALDDDNPWTHVPAKAYGDHMIELNNAQLALEVIGKRIAIFASIVPNAATLAAEAEKMHSYLAEVITEYERHRTSKVSQGGVRVPLADFPSLSGFMLRQSKSSFGRFAEPYHTILECLQKGAVRVAL